MNGKLESRQSITRLAAAIKAGAMLALLGLIVIMVERPLHEDAANPDSDSAGKAVHSVSGEISGSATDGQSEPRGGDRSAAVKTPGLPWNFYAPGTVGDALPPIA